MTSTESSEIGVASRRLVGSAVRKYVYTAKAAQEPDPYTRLLGVEEMIFEAAHKEWLQLVMRLGDVSDEHWRLEAVASLLDARTQALNLVRGMFERLGVSALKEIAGFIELYDFETLLPKGAP